MLVCGRARLRQITDKYGGDISFFEHNLETWRQMWRVLEISDVVLLVVDARYPSLHFPPSFYEYVTQTLKRELILILNKVGRRWRGGG